MAQPGEVFGGGAGAVGGVLTWLTQVKIYYRTAGIGGWTLLGDESDRTNSIRDYRPSMHGLAQVTPLIWGATQFVAARNNRIWTLTFAIERTHGTLDAALNFLASHPLALPDAVDLMMVQGGSAVYLMGAVMVGFGGVPEGLSSVCNYSFTGNYTTGVAGTADGSTD